ncbi:callose synthase 2 [Quercus suber]|uniref:Callose synthase 2 n=1 Tax=Quercus suber TaxID=58331 RepID=A0AAW0K4J0_QUESU
MKSKMKYLNVAEGIQSGLSYTCLGPEMSHGSGSGQPPPVRRILRTQTAGNLGDPTLDSEVLPSSLLEIAPILRVANEVEASNPRIPKNIYIYDIQGSQMRSSSRWVRSWQVPPEATQTLTGQWRSIPS